MKALTLTQPWATLIALGIKRIENRPWKPPANMIGERFAIHASREVDEQVFTALVAEEYLQHNTPGRDTPIPTSEIVATAVLRNWITTEAEATLINQDRWWSGPYAFVLDDIRPIVMPTKIKGALSFWRLPDDIAAEIARLGG